MTARLVGLLTLASCSRPGPVTVGPDRAATASVDASLDASSNIDQLLVPMGLRAIEMPAGDAAALRAAIAFAEGLRLVFVETPANPTLRMSDLAAAGVVMGRDPGINQLRGARAILGNILQEALDAVG
ncbi:MAG: hypothetical protein HYV09_32580 [Deltaproteobacteria bacterium]|nr:hypothetical protein [Deltaproteobacteria bacterium]